MAWPIQLDDVLEARKRLAPHLSPTPLLHHPVLQELVGGDLQIRVKHENHQPTGSFKVRNGLSAMSALSAEQRRRGVVAASRGNHGLGLSYAGQKLGVPVTICVPLGNSPDKNLAMRALGATLVEEGRDYDEAVEVAQSLVENRGMTLIHSTNNREVIAGAATLTAEILEQDPEIDALVVAVGGGSQAVGALTVTRAHQRRIEVFGVQAAGASAIHDGFHRGETIEKDAAVTIADGLATRSCYEMTFDALCEGLCDFVTVTENDIASAVRMYLRGTHNLAEGAGAVGLAGLVQLRDRLAGRRVAIILSGCNLHEDLLLRILRDEIR